MKNLKLNGVMLAGMMLLVTACGDGYSNLSPSSSQSPKSNSTEVGRGKSSDDMSPSRGGGSGDESQTDLERGTNAWFAQESVEHALRLAVASNPAVAAAVVSTSSAINGIASTVEINLADGSKIVYGCAMFDSTSRGGTVLKKDVTCSIAR